LAESGLLNQIGYPFRAGEIDKACVEKLQMLHDTLFELHRPLPIPCSFLIDRQGRVTAVYKGPVSVDQLIADRKKLSAKTTTEWRMATLEFPGRWVMPPRQRHLFDFVTQLADRGYLQDCKRYVALNENMFRTHPSWPALARKINGKEK